MSALFLGRDASAADFRLDPAKLRTHGVIVGMTGSGKTGLCLVMLEELVRAGVPIIAIDPKGDLGNLGLVFPELRGADFAPWVEGGDGEGTAQRWKEGLSRWSLGTPEMAALKSRIDLTIYTPGSDAGVGVNVLAALSRPPQALVADEEARLALVADTVSGLLGLVGREADPVRDPAHIVLSRVLDEAWTGGEDLDLEGLILRLVDPPFKKVGVFPTDRFFPPDDRMSLAMDLNGVIASPTFASWTRGVGLEVERMLDNQGGKVPVSVFTLAHLSEPERQFFLSLLLGRVQAWTRSQPGTERLRAVLFFDEVAGYLPPHPKRPATKGPLLTMMKQARAMGLGVVLATQNPVDVDYKALSNAGLWAIGRLRTEQDRDRVLKGLPGEGLHGTVEGLPKRHFLIAQAAGAADVVGVRHAMCYLRGPFTRVDIERLQGGETVLSVGAPQAPTAPQAPQSVSPNPRGAPAAPAAPDPHPDAMPAPPELAVPQRFLDPRVAFAARMEGAFERLSEPARPDGKVVFRPALHAHLGLRFDEDRQGFVLDETLRRVYFPLGDTPPTEPMAVALDDRDLLSQPPQGALFEPLPEWMDTDREISAAEKRVLDDVYRTECRGMFANASLRLYGRGGETREAFDARCKEAVEDAIDEKVAALKEKIEGQVERIEDRIRAKEAKVVELEGVVKGRQAEEWLNIGETVLSFFSGRKKSLSSAMSKRRQVGTAQSRVEQANLQLEQWQEEINDLQEQLETQMAQLRAEEEAKLADTEEREVRLERNDIAVKEFSLLWVPVTRAL